VVTGSRIFAGRRPRWAWSAAGATLAAQAAVFPLLLIHFGSVPLLAPLANLVAAPLVTLATAVGGAGVVAGLAPLRDLGLLAAGAVLGLARSAADWPQLGWAGSAALVAAAVAAGRRRLRPLVVAGAAGAVLFAVAVSAPWPGVTTVTVLDVGEGDAILVQDPGGGVVLVDGGRDPLVLGRRLRAHGIDRIDLLVVTHGDADHAGGLVGLPARVRVGRVGYPRYAVTGPQIDDLLAAAADAGTPVEEVGAGRRVRIGATTVEVLGPGRRYAADNDGSVVLVVAGPAGSMLLPGDVEAVAQRDLGLPAVDAMVVPHHGSGTTDPGWLAEMAPPVAVISVGPNGYGHPDPGIVALLEGLGVTVLRTDLAGDVAVRLGP
jgi:competence protein ComEC